VVLSENSGARLGGDSEMASFIEQVRRVEFVETDMAGIVHFSRFYIWMEQLEHEFFRSIGLSIMQQLEDGTVIGWPRVSAQCRFESPARYDELITARLTIQRIGVKSLTFDVVFRRGERVLARGSMKTVCCRLRPGHELESLEIPALYLERIQEHREVDAG
jgi:YbgC/YbaW family acyl-CoA thioester hydrolase